MPSEARIVPYKLAPAKVHSESTNPILHLSQYGLLFCNACRSVIVYTRLDVHLRHSHQIKPPLRRSVVAEYKDCVVAQIEDDVAPLPDGSPPLDFLAPPVRGYHCRQCPFKTISWPVYRSHLNKAHTSRWESITKSDVSCMLQAWTTLKNSYVKYWRVDMCVRENDATTPSPEGRDTRLADPSTLEHDDADAFALQQMEAEEEARLAEKAQGFICLFEELEHDENTEWLRGCGWPRWFDHKPLHLMTSTATTPSRREEDLNLGSWNGVEWISDATMEASLRTILEITSCVFARCEETLLQTPRVFCCWLRSWGMSFYPYPFELPQRSQTKQRYYFYFNRFLCYVFRAWRLCLKLGQNLQEIYGLQLTQDQLLVMEVIWRAIGKLQAGSTTPAPASLFELVFQLFVLFWTDVATDGAMEAKAIVHFSGVLGVHPNELAFRSAYDYTPYLSAMIWVGRLVVLEYALPLRPYQSLEIPWPERAAYANQAERFCGQIRPKFLQRGSVSPIGYLIERLQHGRAIAKREGPRTNIS